MLSVIILGVVVSYGLTQLFLTLLMRRSPLPPLSPPPFVPQVLVPFRNEEAYLESLLKALQKQSLRLKLVFGDDESTDGSREVLQKHLRGENEVCIRSISAECRQGYPGKHGALVCLEKEIETEIFFLADADMQFPPKWAESLYKALLGEKHLGGVCGPSLPRARTLWEAFQRVEWASTLYLIAASQRLGHVPTAIGNSMAVRKSAWEAVGGWRSLPPSLVEDYTFMRALEKAGWKFKWIFHPDVLGETRAEPTFSKWVQQRLRWRFAAQNLPPHAIGYLLLQSALPWMMGLMEKWLLVIAALIWGTAEALPLAQFRSIVGGKQILRYLPLLLLYRFFQGPWLLWLHFSRKPIQWRGRTYPK
ncbi:MAG: glycosyltransferase [Bacteroidia bacterium]|nr:glycosyltransferase [Bacteroidia bacterium]MCX7764420.1 glycosyltransferase [Bacteroidia bacterium]